jgi:predicted DNA-binding transcriptional regulator YafY
MRADRLLSILMLLQARGRMTAQELAGELEVSERTIYRDMDALSAAGVPVYAERGPGGGCALLDSYRTTLTGLTQDEVRALFMLSIPAPLAELGVGRELKAALSKLAAALPASRRHDEAQVRQRIHLDPVGWSEARVPAPYLSILQQAVWQDRKLSITYRLPFEAQAEWLVEPYGLVAKASAWHLVCGRNGSLRVCSASRVVDARLSDETFERPPDFDLAAFWQSWCADVEDNRLSYPVSLRVASEFIPWLTYHFGDAIRDEIRRAESARAGPGDAEGWIRLTVPFETLEEARERLLGLGCAVEVLEPIALRRSLADFARQVLEMYAA